MASNNINGPGFSGPGDPPPVPATVAEVCDNHSVGVVITDSRDRVLLITRATLPVGRAPIAGHRDDHGSVEDTARDEVAEEVQLTVTSLVRVVDGRWRTNACRRQHGPEGLGHRWTIFLATAAGEVRPDPAAASDAAWYTRAELRVLAGRTIAYATGALTAPQFAANPGLEPAWLAFVVELGLIDNVDPADLAATEILASTSPYTLPTARSR
ncbi:NUDIX hydrolase [Plantactinospora sp. WMMB334]|uniref:NUDIX hydrolase n=1 Tax=Plantactinospora sp. WMMB334 TaxID=3404119 RepID=UPI003B94506D